MKAAWIGLGIWVLAGLSGQAQEPLPLEQVVLYTAGVAYFEHAATIEDSTELQMQVAADQMNDLLKSLVIQDPAAQQLPTVAYASQAPAAHILKSFAIQLQDNPAMAELLRQLRGVAVRVQATEEMVGTIVSLETREERVEDELQKIAVLNLATDQGLRSIPLPQIRSWQLLDQTLSREMDKALAVLRETLNLEKKTVVFRFQGAGRRQVRIGYMRSVPVWKMSYRLILGRDGAHWLQGWAIVENTTEQDWDSVRLSLVSGQPISFEMPLYQPMYAQRPTVQLDLYNALRPPTYEQELGEAAGRAVAKQGLERQVPAPRALAGAAPAEGADQAAVVPSAQGLASRAASVAVGAAFQYVLDRPVSVRRQRAALLPVLNRQVPAEHLSIYQESVDPKHPLRGVRLRNPTDAYWMAGPVSVFEAGRYAGEALLEGVTAGGEQLLSYAVDLELEVAPRSRGEPQRLVDVRLAGGTLFASYKLVRQQHYRIRNRAQQRRELLLLYPNQPDWQLVSPAQAAAVSRDQYRFKLELAAGETQDFTVRVERTVREQLVLSNLGVEELVRYQSAPAISAEVKQALAEVVRRQRELDRLQQERQQAQAELAEIAQQQERIRQNLSQVQRNTELHARYLNKLASQEDTIEQLRARSQELGEQIQQQQAELADYLAGLTVP